MLQFVAKRILLKQKRISISRSKTFKESAQKNDIKELMLRFDMFVIAKVLTARSKITSRTARTR